MLKHRAEVFRQTRCSSHKPGVPHMLPQLPVFGDTGSGPKQRAGRKTGGRAPDPSPRVLQAEQSLRSFLLLKISACTAKRWCKRKAKSRLGARDRARVSGRPSARPARGDRAPAAPAELHRGRTPDRAGPDPAPPPASSRAGRFLPPQRHRPLPGPVARLQP